MAVYGAEDSLPRKYRYATRTGTGTLPSLLSVLFFSKQKDTFIHFNVMRMYMSTGNPQFHIELRETYFTHRC
jgi:hypothetical protein